MTTSSGDTYRGTLAQGFGSGRVPDEYGLCWNGTDLDEACQPDPVPAGAYHPVAGGRCPPGIARWCRQDDLESACRDVATVLMRTERPVQAGELVSVDRRDRRWRNHTPDAPLTVGCFACGRRTPSAQRQRDRSRRSSGAVRQLNRAGSVAAHLLWEHAAPMGGRRPGGRRPTCGVGRRPAGPGSGWPEPRTRRSGRAPLRSGTASGWSPVRPRRAVRYHLLHRRQRRGHRGAVLGLLAAACR